MAITILDTYLANQIAAGEVIERPASVIKELLENSLDAGASKLDLEIKKGGLELIQVRDNGVGIVKNDLPLTIRRYATSKITCIDDLEKLLTLGFRGEALASISSVAKLILTSRLPDESVAWQIAADGKDAISKIMPIAHPPGTTIAIRDLFFNVPARRKFLRTEATEFKHLAEVVNRLALSRFDVSFKLKHNRRVVQQLAAVHTDQEKQDRVAAICGSVFMEHALPISYARNNLKLTGWISQPTFSRSQADLQYFYVNGRIVRNKTLVHAVKLAYRDVLAQNRQPAFVLYLSIAPDQIDVNVHPTKYEIRFRDQHLVHDFFVGVLKQTLAKTKPESMLKFATPSEPSDAAATKSDLRQEEKETPQKPPAINQLKLPLAIEEEPAIYFAKDTLASNQITSKETPAATSIPEHKQAELAPENQANEPVVIDSLPLGQALGQLHGTYILAQNSEGLILVDTHAAHERITYERLKAAYQKEGIKAQPLLMPLTLTVNKKEAAAALEYANYLKELGLELDTLGPETLAIRKMPALLRLQDSEQLVRDLLADLIEYEKTSRAEDYIDKILISFACHHSVRAHQKLTLPEMDALLRQIEKTPRANQCSHGRPTWRQITLAEIHRMFLR